MHFIWLVLWVSKFGIRFYAIWCLAVTCVYVKMFDDCYTILWCMLQNRVLLGCLKQHAVSSSIVRTVICFLSSSFTEFSVVFRLFYHCFLYLSWISLFNGAFVLTLNPLRGSARFNSQQCNFIQMNIYSKSFYDIIENRN